MSQVFVVIYGILLFSQKKIEIHKQNSMESICIHRSLLAELKFSQKRLPTWKTMLVKKGEVKVTLFPGMVFQERILF